MPRINYFESKMSEDEGIHDIMSLLTTKSRVWHYEEEYRLIRWHRVDSALSIGESALAEIILGYRIEPEDRDRILAIVKTMHRPIPVYQATPEDYKFSLRIDPISIA